MVQLCPRSGAMTRALPTEDAPIALVIAGFMASVMEKCHLTLNQWVYMAYFWAYNCAGERSQDMPGLGKLRVVSTQGIDGAWGNLKNFLRARGGCSADHLESSVKKFQWRWNLPPDH